MSSSVRRREMLGCLASLAGCSRALAPGIAYLEQTIPRLLEQTGVPGLSVAIVKEAKLAWHRGFGVKDRSSGVPVDVDTMFEAASMSKPVFAYAVLKLCERGAIDLDTPLTRYSSDRFVKNDLRLDLITARHILSHTSGLPNWRSATEPLKIYFKPGEKWLYSGEGYYYLQSVVTRLTGHIDARKCGRYEEEFEVCATNFDELMRANLLAPFGMTSSGYLWNEAFGKRMARPHDGRGEPLDNKKSTATDVARYGSAGALLTTAADYARFLIEVIGPKASDPFRLNETSRREMLRPQVKVAEGDGYTVSWGLGWRIARTAGGDLVGHGGDNTGFHSLSEVSVADRSGFVILTNGENGVDLLKRLAPELSRRLHSTL